MGGRVGSYCIIATAAHINVADRDHFLSSYYFFSEFYYFYLLPIAKGQRVINGTQSNKAISFR